MDKKELLKKVSELDNKLYGKTQSVSSYVKIQLLAMELHKKGLKSKDIILKEELI